LRPELWQRAKSARRVGIGLIRISPWLSLVRLENRFEMVCSSGESSGGQRKARPAWWDTHKGSFLSCI
ncbi:MAG: hypothetical protein UHS51_00715, partial [Atopobiaceae bacterium]|nr:hypothetical protein [Atopobiaceae bacterium]